MHCCTNKKEERKNAVSLRSTAYTQGSWCVDTSTRSNYTNVLVPDQHITGKFPFVRRSISSTTDHVPKQRLQYVCKISGVRRIHKQIRLVVVAGYRVRWIDKQRGTAGHGVCSDNRMNPTAGIVKKENILSVLFNRGTGILTMKILLPINVNIQTYLDLFHAGNRWHWLWYNRVLTRHSVLVAC